MEFRLTEDEAWGFIDSAVTSYVTTLRRDGRPVTIPVWHVVLDRRVYLSSPVSSTKLKRIARDPRAYFLVEKGEAWDELIAVAFEARATLIDDPELTTRATTVYDAKYAARGPALHKLPARVQATYADRAIIELAPSGRLNSWNNAALVRS